MDTTVKYCWPRIFTDSSFDYHGEFMDQDRRVAAALADGLEGWGICYGGGEIPKGFGVGMVKIGKVLAITPTPENLQAMDLPQGHN